MPMHLALATRVARMVSMGAVVWAGVGVGPAPGAVKPDIATAPQQTSSAWHSVPLPVTIDALAAAAGVPAPAAPELFLFDLIRVVHERPTDPDQAPDSPLASVLQVLREARSSATLSSGSLDGSRTDEILVPLPLSPQAWMRSVFGRPVPREQLVEAMLEDRRAALLYLGLGTLDAETLGALEANEALLATLARDHAAVLATFGRSLSVHDGVVRLPLAAESRVAWEALVGASAADVGAFIPALLGRDRGRLAYFFDAVTQLDEAHQRFVMSLATPQATFDATSDGNGARQAAGDRPDVVSALAAAYEPIRAASPEWNADVHPFYRPAFDAGAALGVLRVGEQGTLQPPASRLLWERVFSRWRAVVAPPSRRPGRDDVDAPWLLSQWLGSSYRDASVKLEQMRVAQRVLGNSSESDPDVLKDAIDATARYPALTLTLERLGVTDPARYAEAASVAAAVTARASSRDGYAALSLYQGLLAIIERAHWVGTLDDARAAELAGALLGRRPRPGTDYEAQLVEWLERALLPALGATTGVPPVVQPERVVLSALAGLRREAPGDSPVLIEWEGQPYRLDLPAGRLARFERFREILESPSLDDVLALHRDLASLQQVGASPATIARLSSLLADMDALLPPTRENDVLRQWLQRADRAMARIRARGADGRPTAGALRDAIRFRNVLAADVVRLLVYVPSLGDPAGAARLGGQVARRHRFDAADPMTDTAAPAWSLPRDLVTEEDGWHVRGSLLGLDVGLARLAPRRLDVDRIPFNPRLDDVARRRYAIAVALARPDDVSDAQRDSIARAAAVGRARASGAVRTPGGLRSITAGVGFDARRYNAMTWAVETRSADPLTRLSPGEVVRLGAEGPLDLEVRTVPDVGCLAGAGVCGCQWSDLAVRLVDGLAGRRLPAALLPGVLASATQDLLDETQSIHAADEQAIWQFVRELSEERIDDYVAALAGEGGLVPLEAKPPSGGRR